MVSISLDELLPPSRASGQGHGSLFGLEGGMALMALSLLLMQASRQRRAGTFVSAQTGRQRSDRPDESPSRFCGREDARKPRRNSIPWPSRRVC